MANIQKNISLVTANKWLQHISNFKKAKAFPKKCVLCFNTAIAQSLKNNNHLKPYSLKIKNLPFHIDIYHKGQKASVAVASNIGFGSAMSVFCLEILKALGGIEFFSIGTMASITSRLSIGNKVLCTKAFIGEGTSCHYLNTQKKLLSISKSQIKSIQHIIHDLKLTEVTTWTTDAVFRETKTRTLHYLKKGVTCIDMEASALMALGHYYQRNVYCIGVVSDYVLIHKGWEPCFFHQRVKKSLQEVMHYLIKNI